MINGGGGIGIYTNKSVWFNIRINKGILKLYKFFVQYFEC